MSVQTMTIIPCDLAVMPHGTIMTIGEVEQILVPNSIIVTDVKCGGTVETLHLDDLITYYEQHNL